MNVPLIEMSKDAARVAFKEYRESLRVQFREDDAALKRGYSQLARGRRILDLDAVMRFAGLDELGRPKLAIVRADATHCWFTGWGTTLRFQGLEYIARHDSVRVVDLPRAVFGQAKIITQRIRAVVPSIPPRFRPKAALSNYHILWEAEWETVPQDPMLLRHLGGMLYAVLAHWDLTELEMAVLKRRLVA